MVGQPPIQSLRESLAGTRCQRLHFPSTVSVASGSVAHFVRAACTRFADWPLLSSVDRASRLQTHVTYAQIGEISAAISGLSGRAGIWQRARSVCVIGHCNDSPWYAAAALAVLARNTTLVLPPPSVLSDLSTAPLPELAACDACFWVSQHNAIDATRIAEVQSWLGIPVILITPETVSADVARGEPVELPDGSLLFASVCIILFSECLPPLPHPPCPSATVLLGFSFPSAR